MSPLTAPSDYISALALSVGVAILLTVPGLFWNAMAPAQRRLVSAFVPVPGLLLLALAGTAIWATQPRALPIATFLVVLPEAGMALALVWRFSTGADMRVLLGEQGPAVFAVWAAVVIGAMGLGLNPLPIAQESYFDSTMPARMVASPPDQTTPYNTAVYMDHGFNGTVRSHDYFGSDWSIASRGPLIPLAITALFHVFDAHTSDGPNLTPSRWPVTSEGAYLARILGWLTNGMVVLGVGHILTVLDVGQTRYRIGLVWAALSPVVLINTEFLWPKLLCGFFILLATASLIEASWVIAGFCVALAWLSHPGALLFLPGLAVLLIWRARRPGHGLAGLGSAAGKVIVAAGGTMAPWLAYKWLLNAHDLFLDYLLADGRVPQVAQSLTSWLNLRWSNLWFTVVPGGFFLSDSMRAWSDGPISDPLRWTIQYAKTLPAELGFSVFALAYAAFFIPARDPRLNVLKWCVIPGTLAVMVVCWGFSGDGLGRNSLEPLTPLVIVMAVASLRVSPWIWCLGLTGVWCEGRWIEASGFIGATHFTWSGVPAPSWLAFLVSSGTGLALVIWLWRSGDRDPSATGEAGRWIPHLGRR